MFTELKFFSIKIPKGMKNVNFLSKGPATFKIWEVKLCL